MSRAGSSSTYRDELAAAQGRIAALEEQLAAREQADEEQEEEDEDDDPVLVPLLAQRQALEETADGRRRSHWWLVGPIALAPLACMSVIAATVVRPNHAHVAILLLGCAALAVVLAVGGDWLLRTGARLALATQDAKIAEARRLRAIEQGLRAQPSTSRIDAPRTRVVVEDEAVEEETDEAPAPRARRTR